MKYNTHDAFMDGISFSQAKLTELTDLVLPILRRQFDEIHGGKREFSPDVAKYAHWEATGILRYYIAYKDDRILGHCSMLLSQSPHDGALVATEDFIYVEPEMRGHLGPALEKFSDHALFGAGVARIYRERICGYHAIDRELHRGPIGYKPFSINFVRCKDG